MLNKKNNNHVIITIITIIQLLFCILTTSASSITSTQSGRLIVTASSHIKKPADSFQMNVVCDTQEETSKESLDENNRKMSEIIKVLEELGLRSKIDYTNGYFSISPVYSQRVHNNAKRSYNQYSNDNNNNNENELEITGYQVINSVVIDTDKLKMVGDIIDAVNTAGADRIDGLTFSLRDPSEFRIEAVTTAVKNAYAEAAAVAAAANSRIVRTIQIDTSGGNSGYDGGGGVYEDSSMFQSNFKSFAAAAPMMMRHTPIADSRDITIYATITIVYEIENISKQ